MKILITLSLISSMAFAAAATCDVNNSSSSVDQLVTLANNGLTATREITGDTDEEFLPPNYVTFLCRSAYSANRSGKDPHEEFMKMLKRLVDKKGIVVEDLNEYAFKNIDKIICKNDDTISLRNNSTILKYAIDTANYKFVRGALFIKKDGKNICNPAIDFQRKELIDGKDETLTDFIDKLLNDEKMSAVHDFGSIKDLKNLIQGCI